jgi:hypothetical protein
MLWGTLTHLLPVHLKERKMTTHFTSPATTDSSLNRPRKILQRPRVFQIPEHYIPGSQASKAGLP